MPLMKIAVVVDPHFPIPPQKYGGIERSVSYLIDGLVKLGHDITLFGPGDSKVACRLIACSPTAIDIGINPKQTKQLQQAIQTNLKNIIRLQNAFDVISWHAGFHPLIQRIHIPILYTLRNPLAYSLKPKAVSIVSALPNLWVNAISKQYTQIHTDIAYFTYIYNGLPINRFPLSLQTQGYISFVGRFSKDKQPHIAIKAALALQKKIVVGARLDRFGMDYFNKNCKQYMQSSLVDFRGEVTDKEKIEIFKNAEINLHPISFHEPFGLSVVEAGLCGTPTIAFDKGSMRELITNGISGYVVKNFEELLAVYPKALQLDRKKVREHFLQFNHIKMAQQYETVFKEIISVYQQNVSKKNT